MIDQFTLKFGPSPKSDGLFVETKSVTIFVGPNNSGKSEVLREIVRFCQSGNVGGNILASVSLCAIENIQNEIQKLTLRPNESEHTNEN